MQLILPFLPFDRYFSILLVFVSFLRPFISFGCSSSFRRMISPSIHRVSISFRVQFKESKNEKRKRRRNQAGDKEENKMKEMIMHSRRYELLKCKRIPFQQIFEHFPFLKKKKHYFGQILGIYNVKFLFPLTFLRFSLV